MEQRAQVVSGRRQGKTHTSKMRKGMYATIHIGKKELGWDEDQYRDFLDLHFNKRSASKLTFAELQKAIDLMEECGFQKKPKKKAPARAKTKLPLADGDQQRKIRALWISLYHLGEVRDPAEAALASFCKRIAIGRKGNENISFSLHSLNEEDAYKTIEALKKMAERAGVNFANFQIPGPAGIESIPNHRARFVEALWRKLSQVNSSFSIPDGVDNTLKDYAGHYFRAGKPIRSFFLTSKQADELIEHFGSFIRQG